MDAIIAGWWKVLALLCGCLVVLWGAALAIVFFLGRANASGVDEISAGPVKVDFDTDAGNKKG